MAKMTPEEVKTAIDEMVDAGINEGEIDGFLRDQGVRPQLGMDQPLGQQGLSFAKSMLPVAGAVSGGAAIPAIAEKFLPRVALRYLPHAVLSGLGQAGGATVGYKAAGVPLKEAVSRGTQVGLIGGAIEGALNVGSRLVAATTGVPTETVSRTLAKPTITAARTMFGKPPVMAERGLGTDLLKRLAAMRSEISPGRLTKVAIRNAAEEAGVAVPLGDVHTKLAEGAQEAGTAVGKANTIAGARLDSLSRELTKKFPEGILTPKQADAQLQAFQRDAEMAAARGNPFLARTYRNLKGTLRESFFKAVDTALPGSDIAKATAESHRYLSSIDTLSDFVSEKTPETFVRGLFRREDPAQSALAALREFETHAGTGGKLEATAHDLAMKRDWTVTESGLAFSLWRAIEKIIAKPLTKAVIIATRPGGQIGAAYTAFEQARRPDAKENP